MGAGAGGGGGADDAGAGAAVGTFSAERAAVAAAGLSEGGTDCAFDGVGASGFSSLAAAAAAAAGSPPSFPSFAPGFSTGVVGVDASVPVPLAARAAAVDWRFLRGAFSSMDTRLPTCLACPSCSSWMPLQKVTTGPSSLRLFSAAIFFRRSSSLCFSASSQRFRLLEFLFSTMAASARRSAWVMGGFFMASSSLAFFSIFSSCFLRLSSSDTIFWCNCSLLIRVVWRSEARVGMSAGDGSQLVLSDFFLGLGGRAGCSMRTFFRNFAGMASWALRLRWAARLARASRSSSFSPASSSPLSSWSSSSEDESICTSDASSCASSVKPASFSSSANSSSRSESSSAGTSFARSDFMRFPAVERFARDVASHSTGSGSCSPASLSPSLLLVVLDRSDSSSSDDDFGSSSSAAAMAMRVGLAAFFFFFGGANRGRWTVGVPLRRRLVAAVDEPGRVGRLRSDDTVKERPGAEGVLRQSNLENQP